MEGPFRSKIHSITHLNLSEFQLICLVGVEIPTELEIEHVLRPPEAGLRKTRSPIRPLTIPALGKPESPASHAILNGVNLNSPRLACRHKPQYNIPRNYASA